MKYDLFIASILLFTLFGCTRDKSTSPGQPTEFSVTYDFENDEDGWIGGFADYPVGEEEYYELAFERTKLPENLDQTPYALKISGHNHSDDLFMFIKRKITGLKPDTRYNVIFHIEMASQYPENSTGIGGSPGASVYLKVGATELEPVAVDQDDFYVMNIDIKPVWFRYRYDCHWHCRNTG